VQTLFADRFELSRNAQDLLFCHARAANTLADDPVSNGQVRAIFDLAKGAPTSLNNQCVHLLVCSPPACDRLVQTRATASGQRPLPRPWWPSWPGATRSKRSCPDPPYFPAARDMFALTTQCVQSADVNPTLHLEYVILAVRTEGLAAGPMTSKRRCSAKKRVIRRQ
jgi:3-hydroxypropanoate dehydrogenase